MGRSPRTLSLVPRGRLRQRHRPIHRSDGKCRSCWKIHTLQAAERPNKTIVEAHRELGIRDVDLPSVEEGVRDIVNRLGQATLAFSNRCPVPGQILLNGQIEANAVDQRIQDLKLYPHTYSILISPFRTVTDNIRSTSTYFSPCPT